MLVWLLDSVWRYSGLTLCVSAKAEFDKCASAIRYNEASQKIRIGLGLRQGYGRYSGVPTKVPGQRMAGLYLTGGLGGSG